MGQILVMRNLDKAFQKNSTLKVELHRLYMELGGLLVKLFLLKAMTILLLIFLKTIQLQLNLHQMRMENISLGGKKHYRFTGFVMIYTSKK